MIMILKNPVRNYAWGSRTYIAQWLGQPSPSKEPQAELWVGAHPLAPSQVRINGRWMSLADVIEADPSAVLGERVALRYGGELPFLFKILAVERPLSIQVHPDRHRAAEGFAREEHLLISRSAPQRSYRDRNHKPELLYALSPFQALAGFRAPREVLELIEKINSRHLLRTFRPLLVHEQGAFPRQAFGAWMSMEQSPRERVLSEVLEGVAALEDLQGPFYWIATLHEAYPGDPGVLAPLFLNLLEMAPGEAVFLPAGVPHAYLTGSGAELMANSDNVVRGGLTTKHADVEEFLKVIDWETGSPALQRPAKGHGHEKVYSVPAEEFRLSVIELGSGKGLERERGGELELLVVLDGEIQVEEPGAGPAFPVSGGMAFLVPASLASYRIRGCGNLLRVRVHATAEGGADVSP